MDEIISAAVSHGVHCPDRLESWRLLSGCSVDVSGVEESNGALSSEFPSEIRLSDAAIC